MAKPQLGTFIVWSPDGPTPPSAVHRTHGSAFYAAHKLAEANPGQAFMVMKRDSRLIVKPAEEPDE
jgi:hypothetical protein